MKFLDSFQEKGGFTRNEMRAILTISAVFLAGMGLRWFEARHQEAVPAPRFDYSLQDSIYASRSAAALQVYPDSSQPDSTGTPRRGSGRKPTPAIVNINTATQRQLTSLPGIGTSYAERIIEYRTAHGGFTSIEELVKVKGIGPKTLEKLRPFVEIE